LNQFFEALIERQKNRSNLGSVATKVGECASVVEETKTGSYNAKD